jgi:hypothetical protein
VLPGTHPAAAMASDPPVISFADTGSASELSAPAAPAAPPVPAAPGAPAPGQRLQQIRIDPEVFKKWTIIYPCYINESYTVAKGRRVPKSELVGCE